MTSPHRSTPRTCASGCRSASTTSSPRSSPSSTRQRRARPRSPRRSPTCWPAASGCARPSATGAGGRRRRADSRRPCARHLPGAAPGLRPRPRRRHGRQRHPPRAARRPPSVRHPAPGQRWLGTPERFGTARRSCSATCACPGPTSCSDQRAARRRPGAAKAVYDEMRTELMAGQYLDLLEQARGGGSVERALRGSSATRAPSTRSSARCTSARRSPAPPEELLAGYSGYGLPLGEAFQLRDDVLGVFGDPARPASRPATTCARASAPCWSRWPGAASPAQAAAAPPPRRPAPVGARRRRRGAARPSSPTPARSTAWQQRPVPGTEPHQPLEGAQLTGLDEHDRLVVQDESTARRAPGGAAAASSACDRAPRRSCGHTSPRGRGRTPSRGTSRRRRAAAGLPGATPGSSVTAMPTLIVGTNSCPPCDQEERSRSCSRTASSIASAGRLEVLAHHDELVATVAADRVLRAQAGREADGDLGEQLVADLVAVHVVDVLEPVEVAEQHGDEDRRLVSRCCAVCSRSARA
jgi:hypothetical protein